LTTPASVISVLPDDDRRDRKLVKLFLAHLEAVRRQHWTALDFPEDRIRSREAVQVIAMEETGRTTAIEHILLDGFEGSADAQRFLAVFLPIEQDPRLRVPQFHIDVAVSVGVVSTAVDWSLANGVRGWCARNIATAPEGCSTYVIMVSGTPLKIHLEKICCPGEPGRLLITPLDPPSNFEAVVEDRLQRKLGKLVSASADQRVLLFEKHDALWSAGQLRLELEAASVEFGDLDRINEIWMVDTVPRGTEEYLPFRLVLRNPEK
jgi:hypothetical protein